MRGLRGPPSLEVGRLGTLAVTVLSKCLFTLYITRRLHDQKRAETPDLPKLYQDVTNYDCVCG